MADAPVYNFIIPTGTIVPDTADILLTVQNEYKAAFGADLIVTSDTPQGILIVAETLARAAVAANNAAIANQINPDISGGVYLDALLALMGSFRVPASNTTVIAQLTGVAGTIIPINSQAQDTSGNIYQTTSQVTLAPGSPGTATVEFEAIAPLPLSVAAHTLTTIVSDVLGWETVDNAAAQTNIGTAPQSDARAKLFRRVTLGLQGSSIAEAITSALYATPGVTSVTFRENTAASTQTIDGISMVAHSIYACVNGGSDADVANALVSKKSAGAAYNNGASGSPVDYVYTNPFSGQMMDILFDRPDEIPVLVQVTVTNTNTVEDPVNAVKQAVVDYANGNLPNGETGLTVGTPVSCFEIGGAINVEVPSIFVTNVEIALVSGGGFSNNQIAIALWQIATLDASSVSVTIV